MRKVLSLLLLLLVFACLGGCGEAPSVPPDGSGRVDWRTADYELVEDASDRLDLGVQLTWGEGATVTFNPKNFDLVRFDEVEHRKGR